MEVGELVIDVACCAFWRVGLNDPIRWAICQEKDKGISNMYATIRLLIHIFLGPKKKSNHVGFYEQTDYPLRRGPLAYMDMCRFGKISMVKPESVLLFPEYNRHRLPF